MILVYSQHPGMGWITLRRCCHSLPQPQEGAPRGHLSQPPTRSRTMPAESQHQPDARVAAGHCWTPHSLPVSSHQLDTQPSSPPCSLVSSNIQPCQQLPCGNTVGNGAKVLPAHPPTALHGPRARPPSSPCRRRLGLCNTVSLTSQHLPFPIFFLVFLVFGNRLQDSLRDLLVMRRV